MNYSKSFKSCVYSFVSNPISSIPELIDNPENAKVFCYLKNTALLSPTVFVDTIDGVAGLYYADAPLCRIKKAEEILYQVRITGIIKAMLGDNMYYIGSGYVFNKNKQPIIITCFPYHKRNVTANKVLCIDYSVLEHPEEPMHRFIMRKLLPYIIYDRDKGGNALGIGYMFVHANSFVIKPTFQGELDHKLVGEYLANRLINEYR